MPSNVDPLSIPGWLLRGAIREDDGTVLLLQENPQDDPYGNINRFFRHFFDPVNNTPLGVGDANYTAPAWGLGTTNANAFSNENSAESGRRNHYSIKDAREYMYRAVTGRSSTGSKAIAPNGSGGAREPNDDAEGEQVRKAYWATTFRALGDVVHLIQDMGQPQHTRNDPHSPLNVGHGQRVYEKYTNLRALGGKYKCFLGRIADDDIPDLDSVYSTYSIVQSLNQYSDFFSTGAGSASGVANGKGLADYSNRGFYTAGTNVNMPNNIYSSPALANLIETALGNVSRCFPPGSEAVMLTGTVQDKLTGTEATSVPLTTRGLWYYGESDPKTRYSLNEQNYNKMGDLLIPRAVAYSAGLIKHFFRGKLEVTPPEEGVYGIVDNATPHTVSNGIPYRDDDGKVFGYKKLRMKVRNVTEDVGDAASGTPQNLSGGTLVAVARFRTNPCYQPDLTGEFHSGGSIPSGCSSGLILNSPEQVLLSVAHTDFSLASNEQLSLVFDFTENPIPVNATNLFIDLVYRGALGSETDAVVVRSIDMFEPSYVGDANNSDYVIVNGNLYTADEILADDQLQDQIDQSPQGDNDGVFDEPISPKDIASVSIYIGGGTQPVATLSALPLQRYFRLAVLTDQSPVAYSAIGSGLSGQIISFNPIVNQFDADGVYHNVSMSVSRNYRYGFLISIHREYGYESVADYTVMEDVTGDALDPVQCSVSSNFE